MSFPRLGLPHFTVLNVLLAALSMALILETAHAQNNFSCPYGRSGACLGYGDKIVDQNSVCFNQLACGYKGFICKSKLDDTVDEYNDLVDKFNRLRGDFNDVAAKNRSLIDSASELLAKNKALAESLTTAQSQLEEALQLQQLLTLTNERLKRELADVRRKAPEAKPASPDRPKQQSKNTDKTT